MKPCAGQIKYLIAIRELLDATETVRCVNIANHLKVSRPSVSKMLRFLVSSGFVREDFCNSVRFTDEGKLVADELYEVFRDVYIFFRRFLKLPHEEAHRQAIVFMTDFPLETGERLKAIVRRTINKAK